MCGISGIVLREGEGVELATLKAMAQAMIRRGPDAEGFHIDRNIGLAHRRLKILDLSPQGNQPMFNDERTISVVYNGEISNFQGIREELQRDGIHFRSTSDTEVLVHGFAKWGTSLFRRLNGQYAFALLDTREQPAIYLVRDRFGIKPLFYHFENERLAFASELKPLFRLPWISREVDPQTLFHFLEFSHVPTPLSILKSVRQLEPGHFVRLQAGKLVHECFWSPEELFSPSEPPRKLSEVDALGELEKVLKECVRRQVISDVPVGCFLSGGIDSSLLTMACLGDSRSGNPIQTFSIGYAEAEFDETPFAREIARAFGSDHHELIVGPKDFFELIPQAPDFFDQPFADPTLLPSLLLSRFARERVTVALSGDGGDELFFGYSQQRALLYLAGLGRIPVSVRGKVFGWGESIAEALTLGPMRESSQRFRKLSEILQFRSETELYQYFVGSIGPARMDRLADLIVQPVNSTVPIHSAMLDGMKNLPLHDRIAQFYLRTFLVDTVLAKTDRAGMAYGLEARVPFLDDEMAEFTARLPFSMKHRLNSSKYLLRQLLKKKLEERGVSSALSTRKKQGFSIPLRDWLRGELKYLLDEYLRPERMKREGIFKADRIRSLVKAHLGGRANHSHLLWSLVSFQMWRERYLESP